MRGIRQRKPFLPLLLPAVLCLSLAACSSGQAGQPELPAATAFAPAEAFTAAEGPAAEDFESPETESTAESAEPAEIEPPAPTSEAALPEESAAPEEAAPPEAAPIPEDLPDSLQAAVKACATAEITNQLVLAVDHELSFWEKGPDGIWQKRMEAYCGYGANGLVMAEERVMGSKTTPIGAFPLTLAFGTGDNPGTDMTWRRITENSYWSEAEDENFNAWVESETPVPGEHLIDYYQYKYAVNIGFNLEDIVYSRGSAIFLHCKSTDHWYTAGCVSLSEEDMLELLRMLRDGAWMIIVPDAESIGNY